MNFEIVKTASELIVTLALLLFAWGLYQSTGAAADTVGTVIVTGVVARWLQKDIQQQAERQAEKIQEAVTKASNGK